MAFLSRVRDVEIFKAKQLTLKTNFEFWIEICKQQTNLKIKGFVGRGYNLIRSDRSKDEKLGRGTWYVGRGEPLRLMFLVKTLS